MWQSFLWLLTAVILVGIFVAAVHSHEQPGLNQAFGAVPGWLFGVMWPLVYLFLILSTYFGYESVFPGPARGALIIVFVITAVLVALWPYFFFHLRSPKAAGIIAVLLLVSIFIQLWIVLNWLNNPIAAALMVPVFFWAGYIVYLTCTSIIIFKDD